MIDVKDIVFLGLLVGACSSETINFGDGTGGSAGEAGAGGALAGAAGVAGVIGGDAGEGDGAGPCGPLMVQSGSVCVDKQPALHGDGSQGPAVSWTEAVAICEGRGARLCTEAEREGACPGGQATMGGGNEAFCSGPANTWEWSTSTSCTDGRCKSPCCNSVKYPCHCSVPPTDALSFRCCKNI